MSNNRKGPPPDAVSSKPAIVSDVPQVNFQVPTIEVEPIYDSHAYSVVRNNKIYQVIRIPFNKRTLQTGIPEIAYEDGSRWEAEAHFSVHTDGSFLMNEEEDFE